MKVATIIALLLLLSSPAPANEPPIAWQDWSPQVFAQAQREQKPVFLYLEAVWCHWCHVMQKKTFSDPAVQRELREHWRVVKVDHDANPGLANRYRDYGWPALIFFAPDGTEIVKRAGHMDPQPFVTLLRAIVSDPTPETPASESVAIGGPRLSAAARQTLLAMHERSFDAELGGLKLAQKFMDRDSVEYALRHGQAQAPKTLDGARALLDPVWGGVYQYSTGGVWTNPHYEKIMRVQASYLRIYALAYKTLKRDSDLRTANAIRDYLFNFLRGPEGAFYVSQDADLIQGQKAHDYFSLDDAGRRKLGIPRVDNNRYAQENGWAIEGLVALYEASGDKTALAAARGAADWALKHRRLPDGGFRHGDPDSGGPHLGDTLAMGRACLALHRATGELRWRHCAERAAAFIGTTFKAPAGYYSAAPSTAVLIPAIDVEENISAGRFFAALAKQTGTATFQTAAEHAMTALSGEAFIAGRFTEAGILLLDEELAD